MDSEIRIMALNLQYGGIDPDGTTVRLEKSIAAVNEMRPHAVLLQELTGMPPRPLENPDWDMPLPDRERILHGAAAEMHEAARHHLHHVAVKTGMTPVLGPPVPGQWRRMHTAILLAEEPGMRIIGTGPPPMAVPGAENPAWCQVTIEVEGIPYPLDLYSVHFPARSALRQLLQAQSLANVIAQRGQLAHAAGDSNAIPRTDRPSEKDLAKKPPHLRTARMALDDGPLRPDYSVHDTLTGSGLIDIAAALPPECRVPADLTPTGHGGNRVDIHVATEETAAAASGYWQAATGGSDHAATMTIYARKALAEAVPPGLRE